MIEDYGQCLGRYSSESEVILHSIHPNHHKIIVLGWSFREPLAQSCCRHAFLAKNIAKQRLSPCFNGLPRTYGFVKEQSR